jgi:hypothetical protein
MQLESRHAMHACSVGVPHSRQGTCAADNSISLIEVMKCLRSHLTLSRSKRYSLTRMLRLPLPSFDGPPVIAPLKW